MRPHDRARADGHVRPDHRERADLDVVGEPRLGGDLRERMDARHPRQAAGRGGGSWGSRAQCRHQLRLRRHFAIDGRAGREFADAAHDAQHLDFEQQLVAGRHLAPEARVVDAGEQEQRALAVVRARRPVGKNRRRLGEGFDHQHPGHDRMTGKVPGKERLVHRHVLDRAQRLARLAGKNAIDQQERVPVRQELHDAVDVERTVVVCRHDSSLRRPAALLSPVPAGPAVRSSARSRRASSGSRRSSTAMRFHVVCSVTGNAPV